MKTKAELRRQRAAIRRLRGSLKRPPDGRPFAERWAEHKREERALEDAKFTRSTKRAR